MTTPCTFYADEDSCQATAIQRCQYCGNHRGTSCAKASADRSMVTAFKYGNLDLCRHDDAKRAIAAGVQPY
jgi:hypothetical protein